MKDFEQVFQGDVWLMRLPDDMKLVKEEEISPHANKLILQEGEMTGHHHHVDLMDRIDPEKDNDWKSAFNSEVLKKAFSNVKTPNAKLFKATKLASELVAKKILLRPDLVVGLLEVTDGVVRLKHQEHNSVYVAPGKYIFGRQIESVSGEERKVAD